VFEPTPAVQKVIIERELQVWQNTLYQAQVRHRVQKLVGASADILKALEAEMEHATKVIDAYMVEFAEVEKEDEPD
jgi:hypothetical protein